jgi:uncharacterized protein YceK
VSCNTTSDHLCSRIAGTFDSESNIHSIDSFLSFLDCPVLALIGVFFKCHELANPKNTLSILIFTYGCTSTLLRGVTKANGERMNVTYPSVRMAGDALKHPNVLTPFILLDLPYSAALDTVNLPSDAANAKRTNRGSSKSTAPLTKEQSAKRM